MIEAGFYIAGTVAVLSTFMVIINTNPVHALLYLVFEARTKKPLAAGLSR